MIIRKPQVLVPVYQFNEGIMKRLERYARVCYKSEGRMGSEYNSEFLKSINDKGHESIIEHEKITVLFIVDRGVSHEIVRHRIASYSQESTRYCNYSKNKFGSEITVIEPFFLVGKKEYEYWREACLTAEKSYMALLKNNCSPQEARSVLPNSLKTEIVVTFNLRQWKHFFNLRCASSAHPQMRQTSIPLLLMFRQKLPLFFGNIPYDESFPSEHYAEVVETDEFFNSMLK